MGRGDIVGTFGRPFPLPGWKSSSSSSPSSLPPFPLPTSAFPDFPKPSSALPDFPRPSSAFPAFPMPPSSTFPDFPIPSSPAFPVLPSAIVDISKVKEPEPVCFSAAAASPLALR